MQTDWQHFAFWLCAGGVAGLDHLYENSNRIISSSHTQRGIYMVWNIPAGPTPVSQAERAPPLGVWTTESPLNTRALFLHFDELALGVGADKSPATDDETEDSLGATAGSGGESSDGASRARPDMEA